jgi:hypothetical protein
MGYALKKNNHILFSLPNLYEVYSKSKNSQKSPGPMKHTNKKILWRLNLRGTLFWSPLQQRFIIISN